MKYSDYLNLEDKIKDQSFHLSYKNVNILLSIFSYLGNLISIFLAFFFLFNIIGVGITNVYLCGGISILLLIGLELFKRDIFKKFSFSFLKNKNNIKSYITLSIFSIMLIFMSFYSSLNGAKLFASKNDVIELTKDENINAYKDSISNFYLLKNNKIEKEIDLYKEKLSSKDDEQLIINKKLQNNTYLSRSEKERNTQLSEEKNELNDLIIKNENKITINLQERDSLINVYSNNIINKSVKELNKNSDDSIIFIFLSTIIELLILFGVYFNVYYIYKSYNDYKNETQHDPNFQKWYLYNEILKIIYPPNIKINQRISTLNNIIDICKINNIYADKKEIEGFLKLCKNIGIISQKGSYRFIMKQYDDAYETLKKQFGIK